MLKDFGNDLKKIRESRGISLAEISAETRINPKFLTFIESGVFDFQPETYVRSFLKEYARSIGENESIILTDYDKAKAGFYAKKTDIGIVKQEAITEECLSKTPGFEEKRETVFKSQITEEDKVKPQPSYKFFKEENDLDEKEFSNRSWTQKILLGLLVVIVAAGVYYLITYLNSSKDKTKSDVKPKSFNEISDDYKNKITGKKYSDSLSQKDSLKTLIDDSLRLTVKAIKDIRIKVYVDENKIVEDEISGRDSLLIKAKDQFRFSATGNSSVELYLNGKYLKKPSSLSGLNIKNLVIKKDGIVNQ